MTSLPIRPNLTQQCTVSTHFQRKLRFKNRNFHERTKTNHPTQRNQRGWKGPATTSTKQGGEGRLFFEAGDSLMEFTQKVLQLSDFKLLKGKQWAETWVLSIPHLSLDTKISGGQESQHGAHLPFAKQGWGTQGKHHFWPTTKFDHTNKTSNWQQWTQTNQTKRTNQMTNPTKCFMICMRQWQRSQGRQVQHQILTTGHQQQQPEHQVTNQHWMTIWHKTMMSQHQHPHQKWPMIQTKISPEWEHSLNFARLPPSRTPTDPRAKSSICCLLGASMIVLNVSTTWKVAKHAWVSKKRKELDLVDPKWNLQGVQEDTPSVLQSFPKVQN